MNVKRIKVLWPVGPHGYGNEDVVLAKEFDRVTAERDQLHVRLTDVEQKADDLLTQLNLSTERVRDLTEVNGSLRVRIANLERALAGMLHEFDDGVNGGRDYRVHALDLARTLVKPAEMLSASAEPSAPRGMTEFRNCKVDNGTIGYKPRVSDEGDERAAVERDERAAFEADWARRKKTEGLRERENAFYRIQPNDRYRWNDVQDGWDAWQARAALEKKL